MSYQTEIYKLAARKLGWKYSSAHDGYICERFRKRQGEDPKGWGSYEVAPDAEHACFRDGIETANQAFDYVHGDIALPTKHEADQP